MIKELTCIGCPMGCMLRAEFESGEVKSVTGEGCPRGVKYAQDELTHPVRLVTSLAEAIGSEMPLSVRTSHGIAKEKIFDCLAEILKVKVQTPVHIGDVVIKGVCGTDVDIIATKELY